MTTGSRGITGIDAVIRTVPDIEAAERFYADAFGCTVDAASTPLATADRALLGAGEGRVSLLTMRLGAQQLAFLQFEPQGRGYPADSTSSDLWFQHCAIVVQDMAEAHARVMAAGARPISRGGPQHLPANTGGVTAFKFRDPFGHPMELLQFPDGEGDALWHRAGEALFAGIDHTALAVASREASSSFYARVLGLDVTGRSHNQGAEQSRLDAVPDDDVDVVAMAPPHMPPHLELLAYRTGSRLPLPRAGTADLAVSRTLACGDIETIAARLTHEAGGTVSLRRGTWQGRSAIAFEDPDGHAWICRAKS